LQIDREEQRRSRLIAFLPALLIALGIFALSSRSHLPDPGGRPELSAIAGHLVAYGALAIAVFLPLERLGVPARTAALLAIGLAVGYGITDELHQAFVSGRHADPWDLLADAVGAVVSVALTFWWRRSSPR
jgi:VanZ family protein